LASVPRYATFSKAVSIQNDQEDGTLHAAQYP